MKPLNKVALIEVKYIGPTNTLGSRVQIKSFDVSHRNNKKPKALTFGYDYAHNGRCDQAQSILEKAGFEILGLNTSNPKTDVFFVRWDWDKLAAFFKVEVES